MPETAGPTRAPNWKTEEFRLTALRMCFGPTSSETNTCRVGLSTTVTKPRTVAMVKTCQSATVWVRARTPSVAAISAAVPWVIIRIRRLGKRSAITPPNRPKNSTGANCSATA